MHNRLQRLAAMLVSAACGLLADAHDFWIEPSTFRPRANETVKVALKVGDHFVGEGMPRSTQRMVRFVSVDSAGERPIVGRDGAEPAGFARFASPGVAILAYRSNDAFVELEGPKFDAYLTEKGLDSITQKRKEAGETGTKTREAYSRCAKALVSVADGSGTEVDRPLGLTLEIVADKNPYAAKPGDELSFRVLHESKPLPNALVTATRKEDATQKLSVRSDENGRVRFVLSNPGVWLIATVHMSAAPTGVDAKWQSLWASETFELGKIASVPVTAPPATQTATAAK
jgi:uncharacterized GH25 family protein